MQQTSFKESIVSLSRTVILSSITIFALYSVSAWTGPAGAPPAGNVAGPLTLSAVDQVKAGGLGVSNLVAAGTVVANGGLRLVPGAGAGNVLVSDASGNATWSANASADAMPPGSLVGFCKVRNGVVVKSVYPANIGLCGCAAGFTQELIDQVVVAAYRNSSGTYYPGSVTARYVCIKN
jgi:hypothetical protein